jgi:Kip1 ubiquitination-promoting complex protein 2
MNKMIGRFCSVISNQFKSLLPNSASIDVTEVNLNVFSDVGSFILTVPHNIIGYDFKKMTLAKYLNEIYDENSEEMLKLSKLLRIKTRQFIRDFENLSQMHVTNCEEFMLTFMRKPSNVVENFSSITQSQILEKTLNHASVNSAKPSFRPTHLLVNDSLRKIFITLAYESAYIVGTTPYADKLIEYYRFKMYYYIKHHKNAVDVMCRLGFPLEKVHFAIKLKSNNYKLALDWLIENASAQPKISANTPRTSFVNSNRRGSILSSNFQPSYVMNDRIDALLEIVKFYAEKEEPINERNLERMIWMGYDVDEAREALRHVKNNVGAACAYLAGDLNPSIMELRTGMSNDSLIYKKLVEISAVQQMISMPDFFVFLITMLDNPVQEKYFNAETNNAELMQFIIQMYHIEKHSLAVNQFHHSNIPISALST